MKADKSKWQKNSIQEVCNIQLGTRIVKKQTEPGQYFVYGGGDATFTTHQYNREDSIVVARFALSKECTRFVKGKFFLNDSGLSLIPKSDSLDSEYLKWHIFGLNDKIYDLARGAAQKNLNMKRFPLLLLNMPPIADQKAIASELDALQEVIDGYRKQIADLDALAQSIFLDTFGHVSINDKNWPTSSLGDLGCFKNGLNFDKQATGIKIKVIGVGDFKDLKLLKDFSNVSAIELPNIATEYLLRDGDIIFVRSNGNKNLVGRCLEVYPGDMDISYSGFCIRFRKSSDILNSYLLGVLTDSEYKIAHILKSNGIGIQNINQKLLTNLPIPIPPLELQQQFAAQVEAIEKQKDLLHQQLADAEMLMAERMQYYFS